MVSFFEVCISSVEAGVPIPYCLSSSITPDVLTCHPTDSRMLARSFIRLSAVTPKISRVLVVPRGMSSTMTMKIGFKQNRGTGDKGKSSLFNNERRWKDDHVFNALGCTDELSSYLGVCRELALRDKIDDLVEVLTRLQCCLQDVGAHLATPPSSSDRKKSLTFFDPEMFEWLNAEIDRFGDQLPPLKQFILSGGGDTSASLQYARSLARKAERSVVPLLREEAIDPLALKFLNRLSDLLFVLGRYASMRNRKEELSYLRTKEFVAMKWQRKKMDNDKEKKVT